MPVHETFDLDHWLGVFTLESFRAEYRSLAEKFGRPVDPDWLPGGRPISSPQDIASVEHTRRALINRGFDFGLPVPVDVFLWKYSWCAQGPGTRIGGRPFRNSRVPWPKGPDGERIPFVAQISFLDSKDIAPPNLPGDVLCIYARRVEETNFDPECTAIEWVKLDEGKTSDEWMPQWPFCAEGVRHRTVAYPECYERLLLLDVPAPYQVSSIQATLIGADSHFNQGKPSSLDRLIATLSSFQGSETWPFTNCPSLPLEQLPDGSTRPIHMFEMMLYDVGSMYFFTSKSGSIRSHYDC